MLGRVTDSAADRATCPLDTENEVPIGLEVEPTDPGIDVRSAMCNITQLPQIGAVPKAVSLDELGLARGPDGCRCSAALDV